MQNDSKEMQNKYNRVTEGDNRRKSIKMQTKLYKMAKMESEVKRKMKKKCKKTEEKSKNDQNGTLRYMLYALTTSQ